MKKAARLTLVFLGLSLSVPTAALAQSFEEALAQAYQTNPSLLAARAGLREMDEGVAKAQSGYRPRIDGVASIGSSHQLVVGSGEDTLTPRQAGVQVTQPIFSGFQTMSAVDAAKARVQAGRAQLLQTEQNILLTAAQAYLDVAESENVVTLTQHNVEVLQEQLKATQSRFDNGEVTKTDVSQAQARLSVAQASHIQATGELAARRATYRRVIGQEPEGIAQPTLDLQTPADLQEALKIAEKENPSLVAAGFQEDVADSSLSGAKGALSPQVDVVASASRGWDQSLMVPNRQDETTVMARLTIPLYHAGEDYAGIRAAKQTKERTKMEKQDAFASMHQAVVTAWEGLMTTRAAIQAHEAAVQATELALKGVRLEAEVGQRTTLDVLDAEQEDLGARVNLVKARHDEALAVLSLKAALGHLTPATLKLPVTATYDPKAHYDEANGSWIGF